MYYPSKQDFLVKAKQGDLISVYREILADMETPVSAFKRIADDHYAFLLESVEGGEHLGRFSFIGSCPRAILKSKNRKAVIERQNAEPKCIELADNQDPIDLLKSEMQRFNYVPDPNLPKFCGGAVGYIGYDMVRFFEDLPETTKDDLNLPDCMLALTDTMIVFDHVKNKIKVIAHAYVGDDPNKAYDDAVAGIDKVIAKLRSPLPLQPSETHQDVSISPKSNFSQPDFENAVEKCKEYISSGDVIQIVLSQRFSTNVTADSFDIYRSLRSINPSPYMFYLSFGDTKLIGSSPEILVTHEQGEVTVRPIAGTRRRGIDESDDKRLEAELLADEKERAEHVMLVDLGRNDIGRVCDFGSVKVNALMEIERYSHVMHMVSNVRGNLLTSKDQYDLLRATFPAGTVSGAPKIRSMQIIDELEPTRRGTYAGSVGYFSHSGNMDLCITIRTILIKGDTAYVQAGAGIVADSIPSSEYQETVNKATAMFKALEMAESGLE